MSLNSFGNKLRTGPLGAIFFGIVILCVGVLAFTGIGANIGKQPTAPTAQTPTNIVAKVDGAAITESQFQSALEQEKQQYSSYGPPPSVGEAGQIRAAAFSQLENPVFASQLAKERGLSVTDSDLKTARNQTLTSLRSELSLSKTASEDDVSTALAAHNLTINDFIDNDAIKIQLLSQKYQAYVAAKCAATDDVVHNYYQQVRTRHILISNKNKPDAQALALAQSLIARLDKGADFVSLVKQYSDDPGTKNKGGDDGFIDETTSYDPNFKTAALALKTGQITQEPVDSPDFGYFIIQATAVRSNLPKDYAKNHQQYASTVTQTLVQQLESTDLASERAKAKVDILDPRLKADLAIYNGPAVDTNRIATLQGAIADYNQALKNGDESDKSEIYASLAQVYQQLNQPDNEITELKLALANVIDSQLYVMLGDLYKQKGDSADALIQYQQASDHSYDNPEIHEQLAQDFKALKRPDLFAKENNWVKSYLIRQKQQPLSSPSLTQQP